MTSRACCAAPGFASRTRLPDSPPWSTRSVARCFVVVGCTRRRLGLLVQARQDLVYGLASLGCHGLRMVPQLLGRGISSTHVANRIIELKRIERLFHCVIDQGDRGDVGRGELRFA